MPRLPASAKPHKHAAARFHPRQLCHITNPHQRSHNLCSYDDLAAYARNRMAKHLGTWMSYNAALQKFEGADAGTAVWPCSAHLGPGTAMRAPLHV